MYMAKAGGIEQEFVSGKTGKPWKATHIRPLMGAERLAWHGRQSRLGGEKACAHHRRRRALHAPVAFRHCRVGAVAAQAPHDHLLRAQSRRGDRARGFAAAARLLSGELTDTPLILPPFTPSPPRCRKARSGPGPRGSRSPCSGARRLRSGGRRTQPGSSARC